MKDKEIKKEFEKFHIPFERIPKYDNPEKFASQFKKCTIQKYINVSYSNTTIKTKQK